MRPDVLIPTEHDENRVVLLRFEKEMSKKTLRSRYWTVRFVGVYPCQFVLIGRWGDGFNGVVSFPNTLVDSVQLIQWLEFLPRGKAARYCASTPNFGHDPETNARKWATRKQSCRCITKLNFKTIGSSEAEKRENAPRGATFSGPPCSIFNVFCLY